MTEQSNFNPHRAVFALSLLISLCVAGCAPERPGLTESELRRIAIAEKIQVVRAAGGLVLTVGGETITSDQIIESPVPDDSGRVLSLVESLKPFARQTSLDQFKARLRLQVENIVMREISGILLYQHARREAGDNVGEVLDAMVEKEFREFVLRFGGDEAKADEALSEMGMDRNSFREQRKRSLLTQSYLASKLPRERPVTYAEMLEQYDRVKDELFAIPGMLKFRLIDIEPARMPITDPNQDRLLQAGKLAETLAAKLDAGEDFDTLTEQHTGPHISAFTVQWTPYNPDSLVAPYDILGREAERLDPGRIAGPIETPGHIFIMQLEEKQLRGYEPFEKVQRQIIEQIRENRRNEVIYRIQDSLMDQAAIGETADFTDFCLEKMHQLGQSQSEVNGR
ncbi:MAG: hypothetical protein JSU94_07270 [Phycisphaerales bacterium]|nr:MAG: hypothetical protein JSU94_07270 [Phycisphaerales bacterium]